MRRRVQELLAIVAAAALVVVAWKVSAQPRRLVVREVTLEVPNWPLTASGLRVALIGDLRVGWPYTDTVEVRRVVSRVNDAGADLVLVLGDLVIRGVRGDRFVPPEVTARELERLHAPLGVFAVLGSHDRWVDVARVRRALASNGVTVLEDSAVRITRGPSMAFWLAGVSDPRTLPRDPSAALRAVPAWGSVVAFTHEPDDVRSIPSRVSVTFASRVHGVIARLPRLASPIVASWHGGRYRVGHTVEGGRHLYVTTGVGASVLPAHIGPQPEVAIVTVRAAGVDAVDAPESPPSGGAHH